MPRVFVTQRPKQNGQGWMPNLTPAEKYGTIHYIFEAEDRPSSAPRQAIRHAIEKLADFRADEDFILWPMTGDPSGAWAVMMALAGHNGERIIRVLNWERSLEDGVRSRRSGFYTPITYEL